MSVHPLPEIQCGPIRPRKYPPDVTGTPNISYGHRLRERSGCRVVKRDVSDFFDPPGESPEDKREYEQILKTNEFVHHTDRKIGRKNVWRHVQQGLAEYEDSLNSRRERLRVLMLEEETGLMREVVDQAQHGDDARMDEMRTEIEKLRKQQEDERLAMVEAKRMQQYLNRCPKARDELLKKSTIEAKLCNLAQMADNEAKKEAEKELDKLWHGLMLKEVEAKMRRDVEEEKKRSLVRFETKGFLAQQMTGKMSLVEEKREAQREGREELERLWEEIRRDEALNLERERQNREKLKRDLEEQIVIAKRRLAEKAKEEEEIDRKLRILAEEELAKEKANIGKSSAALRKELLAYMQYLENIRREEARREIEIDAIIEESRKKAYARRDETMKKVKELREKDLRDVLREREEQVKIKREKEQEEQEMRMLEGELLEKEIEMDAKLCAEAREEAKKKALRYGKELEEQQKRAELEGRRKVEEEDRKLREQLRQDEDEYQFITKRLMEHSEDMKSHPFKLLLKECAARHVAEKEGQCFCPPPLE